MSTAPPRSRARVVCLEGPSAVGKTTLAAALARTVGAAVVPERSGGPPAGVEPQGWFVARHVEAWAEAQALARAAPLVVMDGDPFKALWYDAVYGEDAPRTVAAAATHYASAVARGALAFPDLYVVLGATEAQLRVRRAGDATRTRRHFERHLRLVVPQRRYFAALAAAAPGRVLWLETTDPDALPDAVRASVDALPPDPPDAAALLRRLATWLDAPP